MDKSKNVLHTENGRIDYGSAGGGALLSSLMKYKIFEIWKKEGVQIVNIIGTDNLNTRICDPLAIAFLAESNFDCLADVVPNNGTDIPYPALLK